MADPAVTCLSLCSGVGGLELGLRLALGDRLHVVGFPCPPFSAAGQRRGTDDERWIWPAIAELVRQVEPHQVFLENVPGLLVPPAGQLAGLGHVLRDLADLGFDAEWLRLGADDVGAPHIRKRIFILAQG